MFWRRHCVSPTDRTARKGVVVRILIFGGAGFVGLNIAQHCLAAGDDVALFDRAPPPAAALAVFAGLPGQLRAIAADVTDADAVAVAVAKGVEIVVLGAAITAGAQREASDPETILAVNLLAQAPILRAAARAGVRRVINLSSAAAYGAAGSRHPVLDEETPGDPAGLYAITKWASERVGTRLGELWGLDLVNLRLSGIFGPWERATGVRDTLSPHCQILAAAVAGEPALLQRPGLRDWTYAPDVGDAARAVAAAPKLAHRLYNISTGRQVAALDWGQALASDFPGFVCRLARPGEVATIDLHSTTDRAPLAAARMTNDLGWRAPTEAVQSAALLAAWWRAHGRDMETI
jgi:UDP-glucose 4-epimerase